MYNENTLQKQLYDFKEKYYKTNKKNIIFKKKQKLNLANEVTKSFTLDELLKQSIVVNEETSQIHILYPIVKSFLHPDNYKIITDYIFTIKESLIIKNKYYEIIINLKSFTITAAERYKELIKIFCNIYLKDERNVNELRYVYIYNAPNIVAILQNMFFPFISDVCKKKFIITTTKLN